MATFALPARRCSTSSEIPGIIGADLTMPFDQREIIARLVDGSEFHEFKPLYGATLICGFAPYPGPADRHHRQQRRAVLGFLAEGRPFHRAVRPAQRTDRCSCRTSPASWSARTPSATGIAKNSAKLVYAVSNARVPRYTVVTGGSYGAGNYGMSGRGFRSALHVHVAECAARHR